MELPKMPELDLPISTDCLVAAGYNEIAAQRGYVEVVPEDVPEPHGDAIRKLLGVIAEEMHYPQVFRISDGCYSVMAARRDDQSQDPPERQLDLEIRDRFGIDEGRYEQDMAAAAAEVMAAASEEGVSLTLTQRREGARAILKIEYENARGGSPGRSLVHGSDTSGNVC
jgi:hypothetical protein